MLKVLKKHKDVLLIDLVLPHSHLPQLGYFHEILPFLRFFLSQSVFTCFFPGCSGFP